MILFNSNSYRYSYCLWYKLTIIDRYMSVYVNILLFFAWYCFFFLLRQYLSSRSTLDVRSFLFFFNAQFWSGISMREIHTHFNLYNFFYWMYIQLKKATFPHPFFYTDIQVENHDNFSAGRKGGIPEEKKWDKNYLTIKRG